MNNLRWLTQEEMKNMFTKIGKDTEIKKSGMVITYDDDNLYVDNSDRSCLVIGSTGSGKTQSVLLPQARISIRAGESLVINDINGEIYEVLKDDLEKYNYNTVILNLNQPEKGNCYNPLKIAKDFYDAGDTDTALELLENIGYYLLSNKNSRNLDPFWENSAINYFTGLALYLFNDQTKKDITLNNIFDLSNKISDNDKEIMDKLNNIDKQSDIYMNLSGILKAPTETRGSIISVFAQKIKAFVSREKLSSMMSNTDFDIKSISEKTAVFIISGTQQYSTSIVPLLVDQIYYGLKVYNKEKKHINILYDEFGKFNPIKNLLNIINESRSINIRFVMFISSFLELRSIYGEENTELIKISCGNTVYLLATDIETLEEISNLCGKVNGTLLITPEELKRLDIFEAVILIPRILPIKTKLIPDYQINY